MGDHCMRHRPVVAGALTAFAFLAAIQSSFADVAPSPPFEADRPDTYALPALLFVSGIALLGLWAAKRKSADWSRRKRGILTGAIVCLAGAVLVVGVSIQQYASALESQRAYNEARRKKWDEERQKREALGKCKILIVDRDLKKGDLILADDLELGEMWASQQPQGALHEIKQAELHVAARDLPVGVTLVASMVGPEAAGQLKASAATIKAQRNRAEQANRLEGEGKTLANSAMCSAEPERSATYKKAIAALTKSIEMRGSDPAAAAAVADLYAWRGDCYSGIGDYNKAIKDLDYAWSHGNRCGLYRAKALLGLKRYDDAIKAANTEIDPPTMWAFCALDVRGQTYHAMGREDDALKDFEAALQLGTGEVPYHRYAVYKALGKTDLALADLRRAQKDGSALNAEDLKYLQAGAKQ